MGSVTTDRYYSELPVWAEGNVYLNGAKPMKKEKTLFCDNKNKVTIGVEEKEGKIYLKTNLYDLLKNGSIPEADAKCKLLKTDDIEMAFEPEEKYENPDGSPITFDTDFFGKKRGSSPVAGAFSDGEELKNPLF